VRIIADEFAPAPVPPCFWSINAFGARGFKVEHHHAFSNENGPISKLPDYVKPYSGFTWPFKLSFVHNPDKQEPVTQTVLQQAAPPRADWAE